VILLPRRQTRVARMRARRDYAEQKPLTLNTRENAILERKPS
jgi:hypothetical protein